MYVKKLQVTLLSVTLNSAAFCRVFECTTPACFPPVLTQFHGSWKIPVTEQWADHWQQKHVLINSCGVVQIMTRQHSEWPPPTVHLFLLASSVHLHISMLIMSKSWIIRLQYEPGAGFIGEVKVRSLSSSWLGFLQSVLAAASCRSLSLNRCCLSDNEHFALGGSFKDFFLTLTADGGCSDRLCRQKPADVFNSLQMEEILEDKLKHYWI